MEQNPSSIRPPARVVKLVDTRDLKSLGFGRAGSSPAPGTIRSIGVHPAPLPSSPAPQLPSSATRLELRSYPSLIRSPISVESRRSSLPILERGTLIPAAETLASIPSQACGSNGCAVPRDTGPGLALTR